MQSLVHLYVYFLGSNVRLGGPSIEWPNLLGCRSHLEEIEVAATELAQLEFEV
jgi:hypothetical protein